MKRKIFLFSAKLLFLMTVFLSFAPKNTFGQSAFTATYGSKTQNFSTFQEALQFSEYDAEDITIIQNSDYERRNEFFGDEGLNSANKTTLSGKNITVNLTHKLSDTLMVNLNSGKLIFNCTEGDVSLYAYFELSGTAELELNGGHYDFFKEIINIGSGCTATINNVTFVTDKNSGTKGYGWSSKDEQKDYSYYIENNGGTLNINGGNFSCYSTEENDEKHWYQKSGEQGGYGIYARQGTTNITDGEFTGLDYALSLTLGASAELSGGTFKATNTATNTAAIFNGNQNTNNLLKSGYAFFNTETGAKINANFAASYLRDNEDNLVKSVLVKADGEPYVELSSDGSSDGLTLTFKYDTKRTETSNTTYDINLELQDNYPEPAWINENTKTTVTTVKIDGSFKLAKPKQCVGWFENLTKLTTVDGLDNINTSQLQRVSSMFANCPNLKNIDFTGFTTDNITDMSSMFLHSWSITELDLSGFNTQNVENFSSMFENCRALTTIKVGPNWKVKDGITYQNTVGTFTDCVALIGDKGTTYDDNKRDADYAHIDGGEDNPGYLSTGDYKIFYKWSDDKTGKYHTHTPSTYTKADLPVTLDTPDEREGYIFKGWTLYSASNTTASTPSASVTITSENLGNHIYTLHWASTTHSLGKGAHYNFEISGDDGSTEYTFDPITNAEGKTLVSISKESGKWYVNTTEYAVEGSTYTLTANGHNDIAVKVKIKNYTPEDLTEKDGTWSLGISTIYVENTVLAEDYPDENSYTITLLADGETVRTVSSPWYGDYFDLSPNDGMHTVTYTVTLTDGSIVTSTEHKIGIDQTAPKNPVLKITHDGTTEDYNGHKYNLNRSRAFFIGDKIQFYAEDKKPDDEFIGEISGIDNIIYSIDIPLYAASDDDKTKISVNEFANTEIIIDANWSSSGKTLYYVTIDKAGNYSDTLGLTIKLAKLKAICKKSETDATPTTQYFGDLKDALTSDYYPDDVKYITIEPLEDNYTDPTKAEIYINGDKHFEFSPGEKKFTGTYRIIADESGSSLTINGGTFNGLLQESEDSDDYYTMISCENGTITITGGSFTNNYGSVIAISAGTLKISGGEFKSTKGNALEYTGGVVELSSTGSGADEKCPTFSGQLYSFNKAVRNNALKDGYAFYGKNEATNDFDMIMSEDMDEEATSLVFDCDVKVGIAPDPAFQVGNEKFIMLSAAINAANSNSKPITQLRDYTAYTNDDLTTSLQQDLDLKGFTLDLNGKTLYIEYEEVTITGTGEDAEHNPTHGTITSSNSIVINSMSQLNLKDVTIKTTNTSNNGNIIENERTLTLFKGTVIEGGIKDKIEPFRRESSGSWPYQIAFLDEDCEAIGYTSDNQEYVLKPDLSFSNKTGDYIGTKIKIQKAEYFYAEYTIGGEEVKKYFPTLRKAITEDNYKKDENYPSEVKITLKKPFESTEQMFMAYPTNEIQNINFNIDLSGYSYIDTCIVSLSGGKTLTIKGGENTKAYHHYEVNNGVLNITNGSFEFYTEIIKLQADGTANLKGVTFIGGYYSAGVEYTHSAAHTAYIENNGGTLNIENGTFSYYDNQSISINKGYGIYTTAGTTTIEDGTFKGKTENYYPAYSLGGTTVINGGTFSDGEYGLYVTNPATGATETSVSLTGGTFKGTESAVYNDSGKDLLAEGYGYYNVNADGSTGDMLKFEKDGSEVFEYYYTNILRDQEEPNNPYTQVKVDNADPMASPKEVTLGKGAKYNFKILNAAENTTYSFDPIKDGTKTLITATQESGKWYIQTTGNVVDGSTYTLKAKEDENVTVDVTIKDYVSGLLDEDTWYSRIDIHPSRRIDSDDTKPYKIQVGQVHDNDITDVIIPTEYTDLRVFYNDVEVVASDIYKSVNESGNITYALKDSKNNVLASATYALKIDPNNPTVSMKETETGNEITQLAIQSDTPQNTNEYEVCEGTEFTISMDDTQGGTITNETAISGVWQIAHKLVGASEYITESTTATFTVNKTDYDNKTMLYFAVDKAGNYSDTMEVTFKVFEKNFQATYKASATATSNTVQYFGTLQSALTASKYPTTTTSEITIEPVNNNFTETIEEEFEVNTKNFVFSPGNKTFTGTYRIKVIGGKLTINGGKFYGLHRTDDLTTTTYPLITNTGGEVTITGGELVNSYGSAIKNESGTTKISGGTLGSSINYAIEYTSGRVEISSTSDNDGNETAFPKISGQIVAIYNYPGNNVLKNGYAFYTANGKMLYFKKDNDNSVIFEKYNNTTFYLETGIPNQELTIKKIQREIDPSPIIVGKGADITLDIIEPSPTTHEFTAIEVTIEEEKKVAATLVYNTTDKKYHLKTTQDISDGEYTFTSKTNPDVKVKFTVKDYAKELLSGLKDTDGETYKWTTKEISFDPATGTDNKMVLGLWIGASALNHNIVETSYASDLTVSIDNTDITATKSYNTEGINTITYNLKNSYGTLSSAPVDIKIDKTAPNVAVLKITKDETTTTYEGGASTNPTKISFVAGTRIVIHADDKQNGATPNSGIYQVAFSKVGSTDTTWYKNDEYVNIMAAHFGDYVLKSWDNAGNRSDVKYVRLLQTLSLELEAANWVYNDTENHKHKVINTEDNSEITTDLTFYYKAKDATTYSTTKPTAVGSYTVKAVYETSTATGETEPVDFDILYKVQFVSAYGSTEDQLIGADSKATEPTMSAVSGYKLLGWYYTPEGSTAPTKWDFNTTVSGNLTLTARWAETISAADIAALINLTKEYDRGIYATAGSGDNKRELYNSGSDVTLTYNGIDLRFRSVAFNTSAVGEGKTISATPVAVEYVKDNNYYVIDNATVSTPFVVSTEGIITAKELTATLATPEKITKVYDGEATVDVSTFTVNVLGYIAGDNISGKVLSGTFSNVNAGNREVELTLELDGTDKNNYKLADNNKLTVNGEITQAELTLPDDISSYVETEKTYDGTTTAKINEATYQSATIASATYDYEYASQTRTITVNFQLSETGNYCFKNNDETVYTTSKTYSGKITPVKLSSSILADNLTLEKEYDGGVYVTLKNGNTINGESGNLLSCNGITGETVQFYFSAAAYDEANIGDRLVSVQPQITSSNYVFDSSDDDDNDDEVFAFNARITPKPVTVTEGITAKSKVYDGTTAAELDLSNIVISGVITGETAPEITATGEFEDANAGENKTVNITIRIAENSNYYLSSTGNQTTSTGEITRKVITLPVVELQADYDFVYDGQPKTPSVTIKDDDKTIDLSEFTLTYQNNINAGTATITVSTSEGGNYELSADQSFDFTIEKAEATAITTEATAVKDLMYDGTPKTLITAAQSPDGEIVYRLENETEFSKELPSATAAGRYTVYYKVVGDENHTDSKEFSVEATIIPQNMEYTLGQNASVLLPVNGEFTFTSDNENVTVENLNGQYFLKTNSKVKDGEKASVKSGMHTISISIVNPLKDLNIETEWTNGDVKLPAPDMSGFDEDCSLYINGHKVENIDEEIISEEGETVVEYEIKDKEDNVVANQEITIKIDKTAPLTVAKAESQKVVYELKAGLQIVPKYFFVAGAVAMFEATDALSGISNAEFAWDSQNDFHSFNLKDVVNLQSGKHTLYVKISDNAGNSTVYTAEFMIFDESKFADGSITQKSKTAYYGAQAAESQTIELQLNNNTVYAVKDVLGNVFFGSKDGEITFEGNKITVSEEFMKKVSPENNKLYIYINPLGQQAWKDDLSAEEYESQILIYEFDIKYEVKINDDYKFFSEENADLKSFCNGDQVSMTLTLDEKFSSADYISIPALGISKVEFTAKISFVVPSGTLHGGNERLVVEFFKNNFSSTDSVTFPADYPSENNIRVYDDVLAIDNGLHTIEDGSYIWYMDSKELQGENLQFLDLLRYLTDNQTHTFYVSVVDKNSGIRFRVCPSEDFTITPLSKRLAASVNVYPNPAQSNQNFNIELINFDPETYNNTEIVIYNQLGAVVTKISNVDKINTLSLNSGFYSGVVLISGNKVLNFKIIVK